MSEQDVNPQQEQQEEVRGNPVNPLLTSLRQHIPPVIHRLPSQGLLYDNEELDSSVVKGELKIYPMTADDELELKSPDLLFSGEALINVIKRRVPQILKPEELFIKDVDFIMLILRLTSYGPEYEIKYQHDCEDAKEHSYMANLETVTRQVKSIDPSTISETYNLKLPSKQVVSFRPMRLKHLVELMQASDKDLSFEEQKQRVYEALMMVIHDVDGVINPQHIKEWLSNVNPKWVHDIRTKIEDVSDWGPMFKHTTDCKDCGESMELPINTNPMVFFT